MFDIYVLYIEYVGVRKKCNNRFLKARFGTQLVTRYLSDQDFNRLVMGGGGQKIRSIK